MSTGHPEGPPPPRVGDEIYVPTELYVERGRDDRRGGLARVCALSVRQSAGRACHFVEVEGDPGTLHNWSTYLAPMQAALKARHGSARSRPDPDERAELELAPPRPGRRGPRAVPAVWRATKNPEYPYAADVVGRRWVLRVNDFPAEPFFTLIENGEELEDFDHDQLPDVWVFPWGPGPPPGER